MEAGESGGLRGTDGKLRGTSHAILSNQSHRGDRSSFRTWKPTAGATVTWEEERAGYQMEGSASKGQRIIGQERFFFSPRYHNVFTRHQMHTSRAQPPSRFLLGVPPDYQYQMGRNLLFSTVSLLCYYLLLDANPPAFSVVYFSLLPS